MYAPLAALGAGVTGITTAAIPLAVVSVLNAARFGRAMGRRQASAARM